MSNEIASICECKENQTEPCETCEEIKKANKERWCFEWLSGLKDYSTCLETEKAERDRQVRLMVDHADEKTIDIRYRLAILQTQTVCTRKKYLDLHTNTFD